MLCTTERMGPLTLVCESKVTHPDAGVTEGRHPPVLRRRIKGGGPQPIGNPVSQWASGIDPMFCIRSIPTDGLRSLSFAREYAVLQYNGYYRQI